MNIGRSNRLPYDNQAYVDRIAESTGPLAYRLDGNSIYNGFQCMSTLGPRSSYMGNGVSTLAGHGIATSQRLVDVESILSNRNVKSSKARRDGVNPINLTKEQQKDLLECSNVLVAEPSRVVVPAQTYREMSINRFHNLPKPAQAVIYYDQQVNTRLEAKDNFVFDYPKQWSNIVGPNEVVGANEQPYYDTKCNAVNRPTCSGSKA